MAFGSGGPRPRVARLRVASRWVRTVLTRPEEAMDRYRTRRSFSEEARTGDATGVVEAWRDLAQAWGRDPDECIVGFSDHWERLWRKDDPFAGGLRHDGDEAFARCLWVVVRAARPREVLETGVARGVSSAIILGALRQNGNGRLTSIDLPPLSDPWHRQSAALVPGELRTGWRFLRGDVRRLLPQALVDIGQLDVFVHDSLHTKAHMWFEMSLATRFLSSTGVLVADDIHFNSTFDDVVRERAFAGHLRGRHNRKGGAFGVAWNGLADAIAR